MDIIDIILLILAWAIFGSIAQVGLLAAIQNTYSIEFKVLPKGLHYTTQMNYFGCIMTSILFLILQPINWVLSVIWWSFNVNIKK